MAQGDLHDPDLTDLLPEEASPRAEELDEDNLLKPAFVNAVRSAVAEGEVARAYDLVEPLHPADVADLFELLEPDERRALPPPSPT
jgi:magnesium transporter